MPAPRMRLLVTRKTFHEIRAKLAEKNVSAPYRVDPENGRVLLLHAIQIELDPCEKPEEDIVVRTFWQGTYDILKVFMLLALGGTVLMGLVAGLYYHMGMK